MKLVCTCLSIALLSLSATGVVSAQDNLLLTSPASMTPGAQNTFVGINAGNNNTSNTTNANTFVGAMAGYTNTTGGTNTFVGALAGRFNMSGFYNVFMGVQAGYYNSTGSQNVSIGTYSGGLGLTGSSNTYLGFSAGTSNPYGSFNTVLGSEAGGYKANGNSNVIIGVKACAGQPNPLTRMGNNNVIIGDSAAIRQDGVSKNVMLGSKAGFFNVSGAQSTFIGFQTGYNAVSDSNTFVGYMSGHGVTTGKSNTYFGAGSGQGNATGSRNTIIGRNAGPGTDNVDDNVYIGFNTGQFDGGNKNTFIGTEAGVLAGTKPYSNATAIGAGAIVAASNVLILGHAANVGIGTSAPTTKLEVVAEGDDTSGLRLTKLTSQSNSRISTDQFLTVNEQGDVVKARYRLKISNATEWADNVFADGYPLKPLSAVDQFIKTNQHLPGIPSAETIVKEGIDATQFNAKLLEKIEELTLYMIETKKETLELRKENRELRKAVSAMQSRRRKVR